MNTGVIVALLCGFGVWIYMRIFSPRPEFAPLLTSPDDPLMKDAIEKAKASLGEFMNLIEDGKNQGVVKLRFLSNSNQVENLWAEVTGVASPTSLNVLLVTPPVTHSGHLDRRYICQLEDIDDWQVTEPNGKIHGGFTQRAMFAIARRDGVKLPKKLLQHEKNYPVS